MTARTRHAVALLEAANPVDDSVFEPPVLPIGELEGTPAARVHRRRRPRTTLGVAAAVAAAVAVVLVAPGTGDDDVIARAAAALGGDEVVFTEARKVEFGRVVSRELSWTSGDGSRRRMLIYKPDGELESEIIDSPQSDSIFTPADRSVEVFEGRSGMLREFAGDPVTLLARARDGSDGLRVVGEDRVDGERVHLIEARMLDGMAATRIAVSAETFLPVAATIGMSTYEYDRVEKMPERDELLVSTLSEERATVCVHALPGSAAGSEPGCTTRRWP